MDLSVSDLVVQQRALERAVNGLDVTLCSDFKVVLLRGQELLRGLVQQSGALGCVEVTQVGHLVASDLKTKRKKKRLTQKGKMKTAVPESVKR